MEVSVLGVKINVLRAVIAMLLGFVICASTVCSCSKVSVRHVVNKVKDVKNKVVSLSPSVQGASV
jgi:hypothetical protein